MENSLSNKKLARISVSCVQTFAWHSLLVLKSYRHFNTYAPHIPPNVLLPRSLPYQLMTPIVLVAKTKTLESSLIPPVYVTSYTVYSQVLSALPTNYIQNVVIFTISSIIAAHLDYYNNLPIRPPNSCMQSEWTIPFRIVTCFCVLQKC